MKKLFISVTLLLGLSSCQDENYGYSKQDIINERYKQEFIKEFGQPDPNHTWGFVEQPLIEVNITRVASPNGNQWGDWGLNVPDPLTDNQIKTVTDWFTETENPTGLAVTWINYFAQQVSSTDVGKAHMDHLYDYGSYDAVTSNITGDHINNFNAGECTPYKPVKYRDGHEGEDKIMYMAGQSTKGFAYNESNASTVYLDHYVIISGEMIDPDNTLAETNESIWGMYFVGLDYESYKFEGSPDNYSRDWYFNDWIIRISPGEFTKDKSNSKRVMCEDLGGTFDWDFNDIVFDVEFVHEYSPVEKQYAIITLQAAGGTLPIYVGEYNEELEVHKLLGDGSMTPILTPKTIYQYTITTKSTNAKDIKIYVNSTDVTAVDLSEENYLIPQRFACSTDVDWVKVDTKNICVEYIQFPAWVNNDKELENIWYLNPKQ